MRTDRGVAWLLIAILGATAPRAAANDEARARLWGALLYTRVSVSFESTPARKAIGTIASQLGVPVIGRYEDDPIGHGIDPRSPITLHLENATALDVVEEVLAQASVAGDCTWQIRGSFVEVGTRSRLSVPAARERRLYDIREFLIHVPDFGYTGLPDQPGSRLQPEFFAIELVEDIVENVEPGSWDYGQIDYDDEVPLPASTRLTSERPPASKSPGAATDPAPRRTAPLPAPIYVNSVKIATIRYWRDVMIITAPDYIHRQIDGYPDPIPPKGAVVKADGPDAVTALMNREIVAAFPGIPARDAFQTLGEGGPPLVVRYRGARGLDGIDPKESITLDVTTGSTIQILEKVLAQCGQPGECTWQVRRGYLEVGPKSRLSAPDARTLRVYNIRHLLINMNPGTTRTQDELAAPIIDALVDLIEPGRWLVDRDEVVDAQGPGTAPPGVFATISHRDGALVVRAPPFMHRRLDAYLRPPK